MRRVKKEEQIIKQVFLISEDIRYTALYLNEILTSQQKEGFVNTSSGESDKYEELFVNPTLLKITQQRGQLDCGGTDFVLIKYGHFFQLVRTIKGGHISVCIGTDGDPIAINKKLTKVLTFQQLIEVV